jgi:hypothetical protein
VSNIDVGSLDRALNSLSRQISSVERTVDAVHAQVGNVASDVSSTISELATLRKDFDAFVRNAERTANVQRSEIKLSALKDDLDREYGYYSLVRRSSIGTLQAFDAGIVAHASVQQVSEELMIQSPRYWLAPALVALAAWSRDERDLADRALDEAMRRDTRKTSLFFALVLRRQGRLDDATRWLRHYLSSLDPRSLTREFAVVLEGVSHDAFGASGREIVLRQLARWQRILREDVELVQAQSTAWQTEVAIHRGRVGDDEFPFLTAMSSDWPLVKSNLEHASAHGFVLDRYLSIRERARPAAATIEDQMDDLLEILVTEYDGEELPLRREITFHEAVISSGGDLTRAEEIADAENDALEETIDALALVAHVAMRPERLGISESTQQLAIGSCKNDFEAGVRRFSADYRSKWPASIALTLGPAHSPHASALGFRTWSTSTSTPAEEAERSLDQAWDAALAAHIAALRFDPKTLVWPVAITIGAALLGGMIGSVVGFLVALLVVGGIFAFTTSQKKKKADAAVKSAEDARDEAKALSRDQYRAAVAEWTDAGIVYGEADAKEGEVLALIEGWPSVELADEEEAA